MSHHHHHHNSHYGGHYGGGYEGGYGAPSTYNYNPLHQGQLVPAATVPAYGGYGYYGATPQQQVMPYQSGNYGGQPLQYGDLQAAEHRHRQNEHRAEMGALGAIAFAAYEKHEEKVDPAHAHRHHVEAQMAEAAALGLGGYALYEHHEANKIHKQQSHFGGGQHHGHHGHHGQHHGHHGHHGQHHGHHGRH